MKVHKKVVQGKCSSGVLRKFAIADVLDEIRNAHAIVFFASIIRHCFLYYITIHLLTRSVN